MFSVLADNEYNEYEGFEDIIPYNKVTDGKWWMLRPSPIAVIISERFSNFYTGKLTWREINAIKEKMDKIMKDLDTYTSKVENNRIELVNSIKEEKRLCESGVDNCKQKLNEHIELCKSNHKCDKICKQHKRCFTCDEDYVAYECKFEENGRCSHYYNIKYCKEKLEDYEYVEDRYRDSYSDYQVEYELQLAKKENRYEQYVRYLDSYFD
jgi:hypothetical protein